MAKTEFELDITEALQKINTLNVELEKFTDACKAAEARAASLTIHPCKLNRSWRNLWLGRYGVRITQSSTLHGNLNIDGDLQIDEGVHVATNGQVSLKINGRLILRGAIQSNT